MTSDPQEEHFSFMCGAKQHLKQHSNPPVPGERVAVSSLSGARQHGCCGATMSIRPSKGDVDLATRGPTKQALTQSLLRCIRQQQRLRIEMSIFCWRDLLLARPLPCLPRHGRGREWNHEADIVLLKTTSFPVLLSSCFSWDS